MTPIASAADNLTITAKDASGNTVTSYTGSHSLTFSGASASPDGTAPIVVSSGGTATAFGTATAINFSSGVAEVKSSKNGLVTLYRAETASLTVSDGTISSPTPVTVSPATVSNWALTNVNISAGSLGSPCLFTCAVTGLGNRGTVKARVAATDTYGNIVNDLGKGHSAKITVSGSGTISGTQLTIPRTGAAETTSSFTYTAKSSGTFNDTVTVAAAKGSSYANATLTASR